MKFTALKTDRVALDGTRVASFIEGEEYEVSDDHHAQLQEHGVAPSENRKAAHPVTENKMSHPVTGNKQHPKR